MNQIGLAVHKKKFDPGWVFCFLVCMPMPVQSMSK